MNGIIGMTDLLLRTPLTPEQNDYLGMLRGSADGLLVVLNEVLDFSKIEAGKLELFQAPFRLREEVAAATRLMAVRGQQKGLQVAWIVRRDVPDCLIGDAIRLRQVLTNLLGNAVKFTHSGEIVVDVTCPSQADGKAWLTFTVRDTGIGIEKAKIEQIFAPFAQADGSITRNYGGTGLGLAICTRLAEMFGGKLTVASRPGEGSAFSFDACFALSEEQRKPDRLPSSIAVIEPHEPTRLGLTELFAWWGVHCESTLPVASAVQRGTIALVDAGHPDLAAPPRWFLCSPAHQAREKERRFTLKPASCSELLELLSEEPGKPSLAKLADAVRPPASLHVLVAEDNRVNQRLVRALLEEDGHIVTVVGDGGAAVEAATARAFDLVLMDVQMPGMDGLEATRQLRVSAVEARNGGPLPVIALTAHALPSDRERCLQAGMDEYVAKPLRRAELNAAIQRAVTLSPIEGADEADSEKLVASLR